MAQDNCIFCRIARGEIPSATVYEDDEVRAILDIAPAAKGHILVIPKEHVANIYELPEKLAGKLLMTASKLASAQRIALGADGTNILQNNDIAAWQSVYHLHIHVIPRYREDGISFPWKANSYTEGEAEEYAARIRKEL